MGISQRPNVASKHVKNIPFPTLKKFKFGNIKCQQELEK